ncbi:FAD-dependent oxidoreductase [Oleiagrimonas sp. C23AA]|uniref:NAD(P)/FAD-dependent oxidoreductase n=1 Tax=Oleiagrimonas sp. C23AA TaxID=2719047 RepID=UPI001422645A|nr:FAD-dependent oxidoreductase [Oleiagrimonas sp. C23AA]NII11312.1 FAD-dependent oxidoreductase [Oleiagrimonas sp. C23AA]
MEHAYDYVIVGAGMSADAAIKAIREGAPEASIALIGDEREAPYQRPPLSKDLWNGDTDDADIMLETERQDVDMYLDRSVKLVDRAAHGLRDSEGDLFRYKRLLIATGAEPNQLPIESDRVVHFRTHDDYRRLRELATEGQHVAVVGGGFIGCELAASLAGNGVKVSWLFPGEGPGAGRFPEGLSEFLTGYYRERGVQVMPGSRVSGGKETDHGVELTLEDERTLAVDAVVAGLGVTPRTELAEAAGLRVDDGIVVDARLRTQDPDIWAAGDVASFHAMDLGRRIRVEHENAAVSMGAHAGRAMRGEDAAYTELPFFYSDLFDLGYEAVGVLDTGLEVVEDWAEPYQKGVVYYLERGRVRGVLLWNVWEKVDAARQLIAMPGPFDAKSLKGRIDKG